MHTRHGAWAALVTGVLLLAATPARGQATLGMNPLQRGAHFRQQAGQRVTLICPPTAATAAAVYGTDAYAEDSAICVAAIHAGVLPVMQAGAVTFQIGNSPGQRILGSMRNGVMSRDASAAAYSFTFPRDGTPGSIAWRTVWNAVPPEFTDSVLVHCPAGGTTDSGVVWGTDVYTLDSSICIAAVHKGIISAQAGGPVSVRRAPLPASYPGTVRFGVTSQRWGSSRDAFTVGPTTANVASAGPAPSQDCGAMLSRRFAEVRAAVSRELGTAIPFNQQARLLTDINNLEQQNLRLACPPAPTAPVIVANSPPPAPAPPTTSPAAPGPAATPPATTTPPLTVATQLFVPALPTFTPPTGAAPASTPQAVTQGALDTGIKPVLTANNTPSPAAATPPATTPSGRYRVTATQLICISHTRDNQFSFDGRGDEIYAAAYVRKYDRGTYKLSTPFSTQTLTYGDATGSSRIKAGSQSGAGGIRAGDTIPDGAPVQRLTSAQSDRFPWRIWEGELRDSRDVLAISPSVWEADGRNENHAAWVKRQAVFSPQLFAHRDVLGRMADGSTFGPLVIGQEAAGNTVIAGLEQLSKATLSFTFPGTAILDEAVSNSQDRPIGLRTFNNAIGTDIVLPNTVIVLTREIIEATFARQHVPVLLTGVPGQVLQIPGPGYMLVTFTEHERTLGPAIYALLLQVERLPPASTYDEPTRYEDDRTENIEEAFKEASEAKQTVLDSINKLGR